MISPSELQNMGYTNMTSGHWGLNRWGLIPGGQQKKSRNLSYRLRQKIPSLAPSNPEGQEASHIFPQFEKMGLNMFDIPL